MTWKGSNYDLRDFNHDGIVTSSKEENGAAPEYYVSERWYFDYDSDGKLSDDERDEDSDGLTNFDEAHSRLTPKYWSCYGNEAAFGVPYAGTNIVDPDTDGDGVDDQDHDDLANIAEMSRNAATGKIIVHPCDKKDAPKQPLTDPGRVNSFNPCLPDSSPSARTCSRHPTIGASGAPFDGSDSYILN